MIKEFRDFLFRGNIVELAVAFVMGLAFAALINSLVNNLLTPVIAMIIGKPNFNDLTFTINDAVFRYGAFLTDLIQFVAIAAAVFFFIVKPVNAALERSARLPRRTCQTRSAGTRSCSPPSARSGGKAWPSMRSGPDEVRGAAVTRRGSGLAMKHDALMQDLTPAGETRGLVAGHARRHPAHSRYVRDRAR
jgi:large conductance mechanosensitive channel